MSGERWQPPPRLISTAAVAADLWYLLHADTPMTDTDRCKGIIRAAVEHLVDNGLLLVPDDLDVRLTRPATVWRDTPPSRGEEPT